jgi:hypothetical protein
MVLLLLVARRWRAVVAAGASYLAVCLVMTARLGAASWLEYTRTEPPVVKTWVGDLHNASLYGIVLRMITPACVAKGLPTPVSTAIVLALGGAICAGAWWVSRGSIRRSSFDLPFALFAVLSVLLNPFAFEHYFLIEVSPLLVAIAALASARRRGLATKSTAVSLVAVVAVVGMLMIDPFFKDGLHAPADHMRLHVYEVANWLHLPVLAALLALLIAWFERRGVPDPLGTDRPQESVP